MKININWKKWQNITKWNKNHTHTKKTWSLFCVVQPLLGSRPALEYGWHTQKHSVEENLFSLFPKCISWDKFLGGGEHLCPFPFLLAGLWSNLSHFMTSAYFQSLWVHTLINPVMSEWQFSWRHPPTLGLTGCLTDNSWTLVTESLRSLTRTSYLGLRPPKSLTLHIAQV